MFEGVRDYKKFGNHCTTQYATQECQLSMQNDDLALKVHKRMPRVCNAVIKAKGGDFEESQI
jgi:hypothetical protein